jgi:branched-chain amino acid:cation transporter, LIVCS family
MKTNNNISVISAGFAIFSMFFGAGNVVYPLASGQYAQDKYVFAILGFLITSVLISFIGVFAMVLFEGDYRRFFRQLGKTPGFLAVTLIMCLVGPFGAMPRIIAVAYGSLSPFVPWLSLSAFSIITCVLVFFLALHKGRMLHVIGYVLTPMLLVSLLLIIVSGLWNASTLVVSDYTSGQAFVKGFNDGSQTMDLLAAFCFSSIVFKVLGGQHDKKGVVKATLKAGCIGLVLLALTYIGFICVAAFWGHKLSGLGYVEILGVLATNTLGVRASFISSIAVVLACLTTVIALANVFTEYLHEDVLVKKVRYKLCLSATLLVMFAFSMLDFAGIVRILAPILQIGYPALIVLSILNIAHKLYGFKVIKIPVFLTLVVTLFWQWIVV